MAARPDGKNTMYVCTARTGGAAGALDAIDIAGASGPNAYDLADGDTAIVTVDDTWYFYTYDATATDAESDPDVIRPDDYATAGVWKLSSMRAGSATIGTTDIKIGSNISLGGIMKPQTPPTLSAGAAGNPNGTYYYWITYVTANGETGMGATSAPITVSNQQIELSNIPVSPSSAVTARKIYRAATNGGTHWYVATIADNTTTTYTDNVTDAATYAVDGHYLSSSVSTSAALTAGTSGKPVFKALGVGLLIGQDAGAATTQWDNVTIVGDFAGDAHTSGDYVTMLGSQAGRAATNTRMLLFAGAKAGYNTTGSYNTFVGSKAGFSNTSGAYNTFIGNEAGEHNASGSVAPTPNSNQTGSENVFIGAYTGPLTSDVNRSVAIGTYAYAGADQVCILGGTGSAYLLDVGNGTSTPGANLDIMRPDGATIRVSRNDTAVANGDLYGSIEFYGNDGSPGYAGVRAKIDAIDTDAGGFGRYTDMRFFTASEEAANLAERMRIKADGGIQMTPGSTTGGLVTQAAETTAALSGASTTIQVNVPAGVKLIACQLRVDTAITSGDGATSWAAAYAGGSAQAIVSGQAFAKNTKANAFFDANAATAITSGETDIAITPDSGTFSGGVVRAIVYYQAFTAMADAP